MGSRLDKIVGFILTIVGVALLLVKLEVIGPINIPEQTARIVANFWPTIFLILLGLIFHIAFFSGNRKNPGLLVPGGILLVLGIVFQVNMLLGGWEISWPFYMFSVAVGLFELYWFGGRERGLLIPVGILSGLSLIFFVVVTVRNLFSFNAVLFVTPVALIIIGLFIIFRKKPKKGG